MRTINMTGVQWGQREGLRAGTESYKNITTLDVLM